MSINLSAKKALTTTLVLAVILSVIPLALAQDSTSTASSTDDGTTTVENTGILPTNPFYFFKEFGRSFRRFFIFDPVKRAEFDLGVLDEKAAEIRAVERLNSDSPSAIEKAIENYDKSAERLKANLGLLEDSSNNPNVENLLGMLADRAERHRELFDELEQKHEEIRTRVEQAREDLNDMVDPMFSRIRNCEELRQRLMEAVAEQSGESASYTISMALRMVERFSNFAHEAGYQECLGEIGGELGDVINSTSTPGREMMEEGDEHGMENGSSSDSEEEGSSSTSGEDMREGMMGDVDIQMPQKKEDVFCILLYAPVCGSDGKTYSNSCFARVAGVEVVSEGECGTGNGPDNAGSIYKQPN